MGVVSNTPCRSFSWSPHFRWRPPPHRPSPTSLRAEPHARRRARSTSTHGGTTDADESKPGHHLWFEWDYDDPTSGNWTRSNSGVHSRNSSEGPIGAHVYDNAGTYFPTLTVTDPQGNVDTWTPAGGIIVESEATYSGTRCITASSQPVAGSGGCPAGASVAQSSDYDAALSSALGAGVRRILFRRGDTFAASGGVSLPSGPGLVGAYGGGSSLVNVNRGGAFTIFGGSVSDWRIMEHDFNGGGAGGLSGIGLISPGTHHARLQEHD